MFFFFFFVYLWYYGLYKVFIVILWSQVEDIVDTGCTLSCLIAHLKSKGAVSVSVCTLLDKPARRKVEVELVGEGKFYSGFQVRLCVCVFVFVQAHVCIRVQCLFANSCKIVMWPIKHTAPILWYTWPKPYTSQTCAILSHYVMVLH